MVVGEAENLRAQAPTFIAYRNGKRGPELCFKEGFATLRSGGPEVISTTLQLASFDPLQEWNREKRGSRGPDDLGVETGDGVGTGGNTEDSCGSGGSQQRSKIARILKFAQVKDL